MVPNDVAGGATGDAASDPALDDTIAATPSGSVTDGDRAGRAALAPGAVVGRYQIVAQIGSGGMGQVYRARDRELHRDLAIKVVLPDAAGPQAQARLLDEARAMAKLSHPAVVPVFDVGEYAGGVYVVMPLVTGGTLHDWLRARPRSWREVLDRFLAAGRGLVASHDAGLIHRDFKPRNVLLGDRGEVMVADFGIAAVGMTPSDPRDEAAGGASVIAGTPGYMAPEQTAGRAVDARADQYSFCVSLWEGLHGHRPQDAETRTRGTQGPRPSEQFPVRGRGRRVPAWLTTAIERGLAAAPDRRWPSMAALLAFLERRLRRWRRTAFAAGGLALVASAAAVTFVVGRADAVDPCPDPQPRLALVWSPPIRARITAAFLATKLPFAQATLDQVLPVLETYATDWRVTSIAACQATHRDHTQSADLLDRRIACLDQRLGALRTRTAAFAEAGRDLVIEAATVADELPRIDDCDRTDALLAVPMPSSAAQRAQIAALERTIEAAERLRISGKLKEALTAAQAAVDEAAALGWAPVHARALQVLDSVQEVADVARDGTARALATAAATAKDDALLVTAWAGVIDDLVHRQGRYAEAAALEPVLDAALVRAGSTPDLVFIASMAIGRRALRSDEYALAEARFQTALSAAGTPAGRSAALRNLTVLHQLQRDFAGALPLAEEALRVAQTISGPDHPRIAECQALLAQVAKQNGDLDRAGELIESALRIDRATFGETSPQVASILVQVGNLARTRGDAADAVEALTQAVAIYEQTAQDSSPVSLRDALESLATATMETKGPVAARPLFERALELSAQVHGKDSLGYAISELNLAGTLSSAGDCLAARPLLVHAIAQLEQAQRPERATALASLAQCDFAAEREDEAIASMERAIAICQQPGCDPGTRESMQAVLGSFFIDTRRDRKRGAALMREAQAGLRRLGDQAVPAQIEQYLRSKRL